MGITDVLWGRSNLLICYEACLVLVNSSVQFKGLSERVYSQTCHEDKHLNSDYLTTCGYCLIIFVKDILYDIVLGHPGNEWKAVICFFKLNHWRSFITRMSIVLLGFRWCYWDVDGVTGMSIVLWGWRLCYRDVDCVTGMSIVLPGCRLCYRDVDCVSVVQYRTTV